MIEKKDIKKKRKQDNWIYGRRPVLEVLRANRREVFEVIVPPGTTTEETEEMIAIAQANRIPVRAAQRGEMDRLVGEVNHQQCAIRCGGYPYISIEELLNDMDADPEGIILMLDHLEDPQNLGSLLRTADAIGAVGVIIPEDRSAMVSSAVVRASVGATEHVRVAKCVNLVRTMKLFKERNVWLTGLDMDTRATEYTKVDFRGRCGIVVGAEGEGLSRLVQEECDFIGYLPMVGGVESLNAGVAGAVVMYEAVRQKAQKKGR